MKKYKVGFVLGKWYPPTKGHMFLIEESARLCDTLYVLVCTLPYYLEPFITGKERFNIIESYFKCHSNILVVHHEEILPQKPEEHKDFWAIWKNVISTYVPTENLEVVFSSEKYGESLAKIFNIKHICIDINRKTIPISGTKVRERKNDNWSYLPQLTKRKFIKKIAILGPESVGKSTLVKNISAHYNVPQLEEYGREYWNEHNGLLTKISFKEIIEGHNDRLKVIINSTEKRFVICDTDNITTQVFYDLMCKEQLFDLSSIPTEEIDYRIVLQPNNLAHQDGTRTFLSKEEREDHFKRIILKLDKNNLEYSVLENTNYEQTFEECINIINKLIFLS